MTFFDLCLAPVHQSLVLPSSRRKKDTCQPFCSLHRRHPDGRIRHLEHPNLQGEWAMWCFVVARTCTTFCPYTFFGNFVPATMEVRGCSSSKRGVPAVTCVASCRCSESAVRTIESNTRTEVKYLWPHHVIVVSKLCIVSYAAGRIVHASFSRLTPSS